MNTTDAKLKFLTRYSTFLTLLMLCFFLFSFNKLKEIENFEEINVKRINIIENDGTLRMVLSNKDLQHSGRMDGKDWEKRERPSGLIFFNDQGDECGGLIYQTKQTKNGLISGMSITMDRYKDDQVLQLSNQESIVNGKIMSQRGININDYPAESNITTRMELFAQAEKITDPETRKKKINEIYELHGERNLLFLGKTRGNSQGLFLNDATGKPKLMIYVDEKGNPKIQTFNTKGEMKNVIAEDL